MSRWKAAAVHLSISAAIGLVAAALIFGVWYPPPYGHAAGADELVFLLLGVDLVLGPLLTLVVFKTGKKSLRFDLGVIALVQACAFLYGASVVVRARPAFIVGAVDRFVLVLANDLESQDLAAGRKPEFQRVPWSGPQLVGVELPKEASEQSDLMFSGAGGKDIEKFPRYYIDYAASAQALLGRAHPFEELLSKRPAEKAKLDAWLAAHGRLASDTVWLPMTATKTDLTMLLDARSGQPLDALLIDPW